MIEVLYTKEALTSRLMNGVKLGDILDLSDGQECTIFKAYSFTTEDDVVIYIPDMEMNDIPYDRAMSLFLDRIGKAGSMECERIQIRTFFCRPRENEAAIGVTATAMTHFSDGSTRPYPDGWPRSLEASVTLYFAGDAEFHYFGNVATDLVGSDAEFRYRLLSRCIQDCKYFLGCGSRFSKYLWGCCVENHIQAMRILWDSFSDDEKPEWTSLEEIERFSKKMLEEEIY